MMNTKVKQTVIIYIFAIILYFIFRLIFLSNSPTVFYALHFILLLALMVIFEYLKYGMGTRLVIDITIFIGFTIGILLGCSSNPDMEGYLAGSIGPMYPFVCIATYRYLQKKKSS